MHLFFTEMKKLVPPVEIGSRPAETMRFQIAQHVVQFTTSRR